MKKCNYRNVLRAAIAFLSLTTAAIANAVNITYSLTTHFDGRTMTETVSQTAGATLSLPKDMLRGSTTYTFYSDSEMTNKITKVPSGNATVYVDYVFNPPFVVSDEQLKVEYLIGISHPKTGAIATLRYTGITHPFHGTITHHYFYYYGDGYSLWIQSSTINKYITWSPDQTTRSAETAKPAVGWQYIENTNKDEQGSLSHFSLGTYVSGQIAPGRYIYHDRNNEADQNVNNNTLTTNDSNVASNVHYSMYTYSREGGAKYLYFIIYHFMQDYAPYGQRTAFAKPMNTAVKIINPTEGLAAPNNQTKAIQAALDETRNTDDYRYEYYRDEAMTDEITSNVYCDPGSGKNATHNVTIWVKEIPLREEVLIADRWVTVCVNYGINDVDAYFGNGAVLVNKFSAVSVSGNKYHLIFEKVNKMERNTPYLFRAINVSQDKYNNLYMTAKPVFGEGESEDDLFLSIDKEEKNAVVSMRGTFLGKTLTASTDDCYSFFMGYTTSGDPESDKYSEDWLTEQPKFYKITNTRNVYINPFHCWFDIKDLNPATGPKSLSFYTNTETGIYEMVSMDDMMNHTTNIYNYNGQLVRSNTTNTNGLPKGLYFVNGKKTIVR
ncbi:MAG: hypothetical protein J6M54_01735 [Prevotella sp.]|nr:hypothetical protein [Prevotella sp.]